MILEKYSLIEIILFNFKLYNFYDLNNKLNIFFIFSTNKNLLKYKENVILKFVIFNYKENNYQIIFLYDIRLCVAYSERAKISLKNKCKNKQNKAILALPEVPEFI